MCVAVETVGGASVGSEQHADGDVGVKVDAVNVTDSVGQPAPALVVFDVDAVDIVTKVADAQHAIECGCIDWYLDRNDGIGLLVPPPVQNLVDGDAVAAAVVDDVAFEVAYCCRQHSAFYAVVAAVEMEIAVGFGDCTVVQVDFQY